MGAPRSLAIAFGAVRLCRKCGGAGRLTLHRGLVSLADAAALRGAGPLENADGQLVHNPTDAQRAEARADVIERTRECSACAGAGLVPS